jgi:hypothetical protein
MVDVDAVTVEIDDEDLTSAETELYCATPRSLYHSPPNLVAVAAGDRPTATRANPNLPILAADDPANSFPERERAAVLGIEFDDRGDDHLGA